MSITADHNLADLTDEALVLGLRDLFKVYRGESPVPSTWKRMGVDVKTTLQAWMLEADRRKLYEDRPEGRHYTHVPQARDRVREDIGAIREHLRKRSKRKAP